MQTILGAGGAIGIELAKALPQYTNKIRLVGRHPKKVNDTDELFQADLMHPEEVIKAVEGSEVVYLTVGLPYNIKVWRSQWPLVMRNVIDACTEKKARLVFFDNVYMYDNSSLDPMTEEQPINPASKKGEVRRAIAQMLLDEVKKGRLTALIARSADFYGPGIKNTSVLAETVFKPLSSGKQAKWMSSVQCKHSYTYTPDAGRATALLGNTKDAFQQVWHLPTAFHPMTGKKWIETIARELGAKPKYQVIPKFVVRVMGLFIPIMKELYEMMYQYDRDYVFDSHKFNTRFNFEPTPYALGIKEIVERDYQKNL